MWGGRISLRAPMLFAVGFLVTFLIGGITGVLAARRRSTSRHDTYFVVAHMHYVMFAASVFAVFAGVYYWFPKFTGRSLRDARARCTSADLRRLQPDVLRAAHPRPRRHAAPRRHLPQRRLTTLNLISSIGSFLLAIGVLPFLWNCGARCARASPRARDPVGRPHARVGHDVAAARAQLRLAAADPLEPAGVGPRPPKPSGDRAATGAADRHEGRGRASSRRQRVLRACSASIYWFASYEDAGTTMLAASAFLGRALRRRYLLCQRGVPGPARGPIPATLAEGAGPVDAVPDLERLAVLGVGPPSPRRIRVRRSGSSSTAPLLLGRLARSAGS